MCLSDCSRCKFATRSRHHVTDIGCAIAPAYWEMWNRLKDLSAPSIGCMPIESCREFEGSEDMKPLTLTLTLTRQQWQIIATVRNAPEPFTQQVFSSLGLEAPSNSISMISVESSNIEAIGYNSTQRLLQVNFHSGHGYHYFQVPPQTFQEFLHTHSKGRFLNAHIKSYYTYQQIF